MPKTGFSNGFANVPGQKYYKYHGIVRSCDIEPILPPYLEFPTESKYGPTLWKRYNAIFNISNTRIGSPYLVVHDDVNGDSFDGMLGQVYSFVGAYFKVGRFGMGFEVIGLPTGSKIVGATICLNPTGSALHPDFDVVIRNGMPNFPHVVPELGDYNKDNYFGNGGGMNTADGHLGWMKLNDVGLSWIKRSGMTKFVLVSQRDIDSVQPYDWEFIVYDTAANNVRLVVSYKERL